MNKQVAITDSFIKSMLKLSDQEKKLVFNTVKQISENPKAPSLHIHGIDREKCDKKFVSARVNLDLRIIMVRRGEVYTLLYVNHHDAAYDWCEGKFDAILQRMSGTSRMKDFYDIYYLSGLFDFEGEILVEAVKSTLAHRNRELPEDVFDEIEDFKNNDSLNIQWNAFNPAKESRLLFDDVLDRLVVFLEPIYQNILTDSNYNKRWSCESKMWI